MVFKYVGAAVLAWILSYLYACTPERWTSFERFYKETFNRLVLPLVSTFLSTEAIPPLLI